MSLKSVKKIKVSGCTVIEQLTSVEIHSFTDSSERCYGTDVYCKPCDALGSAMTTLIASKLRVSNVKNFNNPDCRTLGRRPINKTCKKSFVSHENKSD